MPNLRQIADILIRSVSGGVNTSDGKYDELYIEALVPQLREEAIKIDYFGGRTRAASRRLDYSWSQSTTVTRDTTQTAGADFITFTLPKPIAIGKNLNGIIYAGKLLDSVEFTQFLNRSDVANMKVRNYFNGDNIGFIHEGGKLLIFGNSMLEEINVRGIFAIPQDVSGFNIEVDDYPVSESLILIMTDLFKQQMNVNIQKPADTVLNGKEN